MISSLLCGIEHKEIDVNIYEKISTYLKAYKEAEDYFKRKVIVENYPRIIAIELTNKCNFRCTFCPPFTRKQGFMDIDLLKMILEKTKFTDDLVQLHFHGESLLHPKLAEAICLCKKYGLKVGLSTNGSLLDEKRSKLLIESQLDQLIIAFDGVSKEIYEKYRVNAVYDKVKERILNYLSIKESMKAKLPYTDLHVIKTAEAMPYIEDFVESWKKSSVDQITVKSFSTRAGQVSEAQAKEKDWYFGKRAKRYPCQWFWNAVIITYDGKVVPCCHDMEGKLILGDLKEKPMSEIWNGEKIQRIRRNEIMGIHDDNVCKKCNEWIGRPPGFSGFIYGTIFSRLKRLSKYGTYKKGQIFEVRFKRNDNN